MPHMRAVGGGGGVVGDRQVLKTCVSGSLRNFLYGGLCVGGGYRVGVHICDNFHFNAFSKINKYPIF